MDMELTRNMVIIGLQKILGVRFHTKCLIDFEIIFNTINSGTSWGDKGK